MLQFICKRFSALIILSFLGHIRCVLVRLCKDEQTKEPSRVDMVMECRDSTATQLENGNSSTMVNSREQV